MNTTTKKLLAMGLTILTVIGFFVVSVLFGIVEGYFYEVNIPDAVISVIIYIISALCIMSFLFIVTGVIITIYKAIYNKLNEKYPSKDNEINGCAKT